MTRREFLTMLVATFAGLSLSKWAKLWNWKSLSGMKEARFYRSPKNLAG